MDNAEVYLSLLRPVSRAPVAGEATAAGFEGQVELKTWTWNLHNEHERRSSEQGEAGHRRRSQLIDGLGSQHLRRQHATDDWDRERGRLQTERERELELAAADDTQAADEIKQRFESRERDLSDRFRRTLDEIEGKEREQTEEESLEANRAGQIEDAERNRNFEFTFTKRVDVASTQMLNTMKAGDVFPSGTLTIHQRSSNSGLSLVINLQKVRLLDYALKVDLTDTMTDMVEQWTAEFGALAYVYKNRNATGEQAGSGGQAAAKAVSQGTVRAFTMLSIGSPL